MGLYLRAKFQVFSIILTSFRKEQGLNKPTQIRVKHHVLLFMIWDFGLEFSMFLAFNLFMNLFLLKVFSFTFCSILLKVY